jgi:hypothetical protein
MVSRIENLNLVVYLQLLDGRLCGASYANTICIHNLDTNIVETTLEGHIK